MYALPPPFGSAVEVRLAVNEALTILVAFAVILMSLVAGLHGGIEAHAFHSIISFEKLRAKILLSEKARKERKPKFKRLPPAGAAAFSGIPDFDDFPVCLGASLSTLAEDFFAEENEA